MANFEVLETRIVALENRTERHSDKISHLETNFDKFQEILNGIQKTLQQIKWVAVGAAGMFLAQEIGILGLLKSMM